MAAILFIGGGIEAVPGILKAKEMGFRVAVSDQNSEAPGFSFADDRIIASTYDIKSSLAEAKSYNKNIARLCGVMCIATDVPHTVATVADALGLPGIPLESARLAIDKLAMKNRFSEDNIPVPWYQPLQSSKEISKILKSQKLPCVIKPVDSRGARGVLRITQDIDPDWAYNEAKSHSPTGRVMIESFLDGPQISTESIIINGQAFTPGFSDRNYEFLEKYAPYIIENGGDLPSFLSHKIQQEVKNTVEKAARSMGISTGVIKGDIVIHNSKANIIEIAARLSGGFFCSHEIPLNTGVDFLKAAIQIATGKTPDHRDLLPKHQKHVSQRYFFPYPGKILKIDNHQEVTEREGIAFLQIRVKKGDIIHPVHNHPARAGLVIAVGKNREEATKRAEKAVADIRIVTAP